MIDGGVLVALQDVSDSDRHEAVLETCWAECFKLEERARDGRALDIRSTSMRIVAVGNSKGGSCKSTTSANLVYTTGSLGLRVLGLDCDVKQASLHRIAELRRIPGPPIKRSTVAKLAADLDEARETGIDLVVIDLPGHDDASYSRVIEQADLVVVPMQPTVLDGEASRPVMRAAKALDVPYTIVVSRVIGRREPAALRFLERYAGDARVAPVMIHQRAAFQDAAALGMGVVEYQPRGAAADEVRALTDHVLSRLQEAA